MLGVDAGINHRNCGALASGTLVSQWNLQRAQMPLRVTDTVSIDGRDEGCQ
jgi:hypothetical protein